MPVFFFINYLWKVIKGQSRMASPPQTPRSAAGQSAGHEGKGQGTLIRTLEAVLGHALARFLVLCVPAWLERSRLRSWNLQGVQILYNMARGLRSWNAILAHLYSI